MSTKYQYSIESDFPNKKVDPDRLTAEIRSSPIVTALAYIGTAGDDCDVWFKADLSVGDKTILDGLVAAHSGVPLDPPTEFKVDKHNRQSVVIEPPFDGDMLNIVTYNFCDKTTWFQESTSISDEQMQDSGGGLVWTSQHPFWIDLTHGKFYREDRVPNLSSYIPVIKVDGVIMVERTPFTESGGDYVVDYRAGTVEFSSSQAGKTVVCSYRYAGSSLFKIAPTAGKYIWVKDSEVQFSTDVVMTGTVNFQAFMTNPYDPTGPKVPASSLSPYKHIRDFVDEARGVHPVVPAIGGPIRGLQNQHIVFPFQYTQAKELKSSLGVEIRTWISGDTEFVGEFGTATFYCLSYSEQ